MTERKIAIYGAGLFGKALLNELKILGAGIEFFIDEYASYTEFHGKPVVRIKDVVDKENLLLLNSTAYDLVANLKKAGFIDVMSLKEVISAYPGALIELNQTMWVVQSERLIDKNEFAWLNKRVSDDESRKLLDQLTSFRMEPSPDSFFYADGDQEYFPSGFDPFTGIESLRFVDCGAYTGDTIQVIFNNYHRKISWIAAIEPDSSNLAKLSAREFVRSSAGHEDAAIFIFPLGAFDAENFCGFHSTPAGTTSSISLSGESQHQIQVARLDTILAHTPPNFIKMDIEGAELEALRGAKTIITKYRPNLAVSVYHKPEHLWEIPRLIHSFCPELPK
ncbi:MAG: FkbM family methyltransferase [Erysipelotrichia bacterium]|nr:FkbM family methyltransferase [Erysipelotrichia bacterium]